MIGYANAGFIDKDYIYTSSFRDLSNTKIIDFDDRLLFNSSGNKSIDFESGLYYDQSERKVIDLSASENLQIGDLTYSFNGDYINLDLEDQEIVAYTDTFKFGWNTNTQISNTNGITTNGSLSYWKFGSLEEEGGYSLLSDSCLIVTVDGNTYRIGLVEL